MQIVIKSDTSCVGSSTSLVLLQLGCSFTSAKKINYL